jgi:hypothetical protein
MSDLIKLKEKMEKLNESQQLDIVRILMDNQIKFSENSNGIFLNLTNLKSEEIDEINKYIQYISDQEENLITIENMKKEYKKNFFMNTSNDDEESSKSTTQSI